MESGRMLTRKIEEDMRVWEPPKKVGAPKVPKVKVLSKRAIRRESAKEEKRKEEAERRWRNEPDDWRYDQLG